MESFLADRCAACGETATDDAPGKANAPSVDVLRNERPSLLFEKNAGWNKNFGSVDPACWGGGQYRGELCM